MKNMKIRTKILTGFLSLVIIGVMLGAAGIASVLLISQKTGEINLLQSTGTSISTVLNVHYVWRQGVTETALTGKEFTGSLDPASCALGNWKNSAEARSITDSVLLSLMEEIDVSHQFIHTEAASLVEAVQAGDMQTAAATLDIILPRTQEVIAGLTAMQTRGVEMVEEKHLS